MKILFVNDGSSEAETALRFGAPIAHRASEPPTILVVAARGTNGEQSDALMEQTAAALDRNDINFHVRFGDPIDQVLREIESGVYNLVIMGDCRIRNPIQRFLWRSTAVKVAERAPCSVLIVRGEECEDNLESQVTRILLCDSGVKGSTLLNKFVIQLGELLAGEEEVTVLHVMSQVSAGPGVKGEHLTAEADELIEEHTPEGEFLEVDMQMLNKPGIHPKPMVRHGLVVDEILAEAHGGDYDLVVVGAHPSMDNRRFFLDNIARQILIAIHRPILVVR